MDEWWETLKSFPISSLEKPLKDIAEWHSKEHDIVYKFDEKGMQVYRLFANEMAEKMNEQWEQGKWHKAMSRKTSAPWSGMYIKYYNITITD